MRLDGRRLNQLRPIKITRQFTKYAEGSVLVEFGHTKVLCTASVEEFVPRFLKGTDTGWVTAEYSLLPRATHSRISREATKGKQTGRTVEIQRLIGRALRAVVDLEALGERMITIDCDVLQADGGTRTAAITGAYVALVDAVYSIFDGTGIFPVKDYCAAVSVGIGEYGPMVDLCYEEDSKAIVDMNIVRTGSGKLVEVQGTGEHGTFSRQEMNELLDLGEMAIDELIHIQKESLGERSDYIGGYFHSERIPKRIVLATKNKGKVREFKAAFEPLGYEVIPLSGIANVVEPEETGATFMENALLKARYYAKEVGMICLADDSGLAVDALNGAPGVYSARYAGVDGDDKDEANNRKLLQALEEVDFEDRTAQYICALALVFPDGYEVTAEGYCHGLIQDEREGTGGFGYDPYFYIPSFRTTMASISMEQKNNISHRGNALRELLEKL